MSKAVKSKEPVLRTLHVKAGDEVVVISGSHRGTRGKVLQIMARQNRILIEGVNLVKRAVRKSQEKPEGGFAERECALPAAKVMLASRWDASKRRSKPVAVATK